MLIESNESQPDPRIVKHILERDYSGGFNRDEIIVISSPVTRKPDIIICDEAHHEMQFIKMHKDMPHKEWDMRDLDFHYKGETPRGTQPSFIGGDKKSKQQRKAMKARRKQR